MGLVVVGKLSKQPRPQHVGKLLIAKSAFVMDQEWAPAVPNDAIQPLPPLDIEHYDYDDEEAQDIPETEGLKKSERPFPTDRRPYRRSPTPQEEISDKDVEKWFSNCGVYLGPLCPDSLKNEVMRTFHAYRHLNATTIHDVPQTDLYIHRVRIKPGVEPWNRSKRKNWTIPQKYWLDRLVQDGIEAGMYEPVCATADGRFSDWRSEPVLVVKNRYAENPDPWEKPRLTFNYRNIDKDHPDSVDDRHSQSFVRSANQVVLEVRPQACLLEYRRSS